MRRGEVMAEVTVAETNLLTVERIIISAAVSELLGDAKTQMSNRRLGEKGR
jgi:hypothetical protein